MGVDLSNGLGIVRYEELAKVKFLIELLNDEIFANYVVLFDLGFYAFRVLTFLFLWLYLSNIIVRLVAVQLVR